MVSQTREGFPLHGKLSSSHRSMEVQVLVFPQKRCPKWTTAWIGVICGKTKNLGFTSVWDTITKPGEANYLVGWRTVRYEVRWVSPSLSLSLKSIHIWLYGTCSSYIKVFPAFGRKNKITFHAFVCLRSKGIINNPKGRPRGFLPSQVRPSNSDEEWKSRPSVKPSTSPRNLPSRV